MTLGDDPIGILLFAACLGGAFWVWEKVFDKKSKVSKLMKVIIVVAYIALLLLTYSYRLHEIEVNARITPGPCSNVAPEDREGCWEEWEITHPFEY